MQCKLHHRCGIDQHLATRSINPTINQKIQSPSIAGVAGSINKQKSSVVEKYSTPIAAHSLNRCKALLAQKPKIANRQFSSVQFNSGRLSLLDYSVERRRQKKKKRKSFYFFTVVYDDFAFFLARDFGTCVCAACKNHFLKHFGRVKRQIHALKRWHFCVLQDETKGPHPLSQHIYFIPARSGSA